MSTLTAFLLVWLVLPLMLAACAGGWSLRRHQRPLSLGYNLLHQVRLAALALAAMAALSYQPSPNLAAVLVLCWGLHQLALKIESTDEAERLNAVWQQVLSALAVLLYLVTYWPELRANSGLLDDPRILRAAEHRNLFWLLVCAGAAVWLLHVEELLRGLEPGTAAANAGSKPANPTRLGPAPRWRRIWTRPPPRY